MRSLQTVFLAFCILVACGPDRRDSSEIAASNSASLDRNERHAHAVEVLMDTTFYKDGKGMIFPTGLLSVEESKAFQLTKPWLTQSGLMLDGDRIIGAFSRPYKKARVIAMGCVACHVGKAAGKFYVGLGNKNIDVARAGELGAPVIKAIKLGDSILKVDGVQETSDNASAFFKLLARKGVANHTQGLVPTLAIVDWFYRVQGQPTPAAKGAGQVKVPSWWGYGEKRGVGQFSDGFGKGSPPGWGLAVDLTAGQSPENIRGMMHEIEEAEQLIGDLLPPAYPFAIDAGLAAEGRTIFNATCSGCHGSYERDEQGLPIYKAPKHIPIAVVGTDPNRTKNVDAELRSMIGASPLNDILTMTDLPNGYFSPRLHGIWARFPYLHNASIPNIASLLTAPEARPVAFSLRDAGEAQRFDPKRLGLTVPEAGTPEAKRLLADGARGKRDVFDTRRGESSNIGHRFGVDLQADQKSALLEYLKTL